jgi:hypothetical protein
MRLAFRGAAVAATAAVLAACSSSHHGKYFETQGLRAPVAQCDTKPSRFAIAEPLSEIDEGNGCHVPNPWRISGLANVSFSQPATLNCGMASPLDQWVEQVVQPAAQHSFGESVTGLTIAASYSCRPRNNQRGARMSEHGYGNAVDIAGFTLESGRQVTVLAGWNGRRDEQGFLRQVRSEACADFMTVLGPGSDAHHRDHIHLDLQNRRSGSHYCH